MASSRASLNHPPAPTASLIPSSFALIMAILIFASAPSALAQPPPPTDYVFSLVDLAGLVQSINAALTLVLDVSANPLVNCTASLLSGNATGINDDTVNYTGEIAYWSTVFGFVSSSVPGGTLYNTSNQVDQVSKAFTPYANAAITTYNTFKAKGPTFTKCFSTYETKLLGLALATLDLWIRQYFTVLLIPIPVGSQSAFTTLITKVYSASTAAIAAYPAVAPAKQC